MSAVLPTARKRPGDREGLGTGHVRVDGVHLGVEDDKIAGIPARRTAGPGAAGHTGKPKPINPESLDGCSSSKYFNASWPPWRSV